MRLAHRKTGEPAGIRDGARRSRADPQTGGRPSSSEPRAYSPIIFPRTVITRIFIKSLIVATLSCSPLFQAIADTSNVKITRAERVGMSTERLERIGVGMRRMIDDEQIPGTVTLVARRGKVVHFETNGLRNIETGAPMEKDTIFRLYSQSKLVTGAALMLLLEEGHFLLTDPVAKYLPEFADIRVYIREGDGKVITEPARRPITIQHLLTHTSGLTYDFFPTPVGKMYVAAGVMGAAPMSPHPNLDVWSKALAKQPLVAQPGTRWNYSVGMDVAGRLVEVITGKSFGEFLEERLFGPLGMEDTGFWVPADKVARFAENYGPKPGGGMVLVESAEQSPYLKPPALEMGGSGLVGTVGDYLRFAQMLANRGELDGKRYLGSKTVEFMMSDHISPDVPDAPLTSLFGLLYGGGTVWGWGFGITGYVITDPALTGLPASVGTFGWGGAATTHVFIDLEEELIGLAHTQLMPDGTYPVQQLMQLLTYQAIVD